MNNNMHHYRMRWVKYTDHYIFPPMHEISPLLDTLYTNTV